jgi:hypothetical protein
MGFLDRLRKVLHTSAQGLEHGALISQSKVDEKPKHPTKRKPKSAPKKTAKELATERGEPYVNIISVELDPENIGSGAFELDWNDKFIANLVRAGYQFRANETEDVIVDRWFQEVCRNVVLQHFEQEQADPDLRRMNKRDLGSGRSEIS